jgi:hypothetical protein
MLSGGEGEKGFSLGYHRRLRVSRFSAAQNQITLEDPHHLNSLANV